MNIGVVLMTFNRFEKLKHALKYYSYQTFKPRHIIVVNNCSTDDTDLYLDTGRITKKTFDKSVITLSHNTRGSGSFYAGMQAAFQMKEYWICLEDDDVYPRENALVKVEIRRKEIFIYCYDQDRSLKLNKVDTFIYAINSINSIVDYYSPSFDEVFVNWGKYYFNRNDLLMVWGNMKTSFVFEKKDKQLKKIYWSAFIDVLLNRKELHKIYRLRWKSGQRGLLWLSKYTAEYSPKITVYHAEQTVSVVSSETYVTSTFSERSVA